MFGYIIVNQPEMKFREYGEYRSYYCGLCRELKRKYGLSGELTLSYDMTFLVMLLTGLYEPEEKRGTIRCGAHPFSKHPVTVNPFSEYAADVNIILSYYHCMDDWMDEHKLGKYFFARMLRRKNNRIAKEYPKKAVCVYENLEKIHEFEQKSQGHTPEQMDEIAGYFGNIMGELFVYKEDEWADSLRKIGFYLGKFIYLMDAYDDLEKDRKKGTYNPFSQLSEDERFEAYVGQVLTMMMAECSKEFERLPILMNVEILRNILYAGVWRKYEERKMKREKERLNGRSV